VPNKLEADLSAYLDGELTPEARAAVERLLAESPAARRLLEQLRSVSHQVAELPRQRAPEELGALLRRQAERRLLFGARRTLTARVLRVWPQLLASAAVLVACAWVGWYTLRTPNAGSATSPVVTHTLSPDQPTTPMVANEMIALAERSKAADAVRELAADRTVGDDVARMAGGARFGPATELSPPATVSRVEVLAAAQLAVAEPESIAPESADAKHELADAAVIAGLEPHTPEAAADAVVQVTVVTNGRAEYDAVRATLDAWLDAPARSARDTEVARQSAMVDVPVRETLRVPATELKARIDALGDVVAARNQVRVQMNLDASTSDVLAQAGGARPEPVVFGYLYHGWSPLGRWYGVPPEDASGLRGRRFGRPLPPEAVMSKAAPPAASRPAPEDLAEREEADTPSNDADWSRDEAFGRAFDARLGTETRKPGHPPDRAARRNLRDFPKDDLRARHRAATEEPEIVLVEPPASQPHTDGPGGQPQERVASVDPQAAQEVVDLAAWMLWCAAWDALNRVDAQVLAFMEGAALPPPLPQESVADADSDAGAYVTFEVLVLPPPTTTQPMSPDER